MQRSGERITFDTVDATFRGAGAQRTENCADKVIGLFSRDPKGSA